MPIPRIIDQRPSPPRCPQTTPAEPSLRTDSAPITAPIKTSGTRTLYWTLVWLLAGACGMTTLLSLLSAAGHDQLWFLLMAGRWLAGARLYGPEIFDSNPPGIVWLSAIPVKLGSAIPLAFDDPVTAWAKLLVVALLATCAVLCWHFLRKLLPGAGRAEQLALAFAFVVIAGVVPARDFGQRDHLTGLLSIPYLLAAAAWSASVTNRRSDRCARWSAALLATVAVCLKPHQILIFVAAELMLLLAQRARASVGSTSQAAPNSGASMQPSVHSLARGIAGSLSRLDPWVLLGAGVVFVAAIRLFAADYFLVALPLLRRTYWAIGHLSPAQLLAESLQLHILAILTIALYAWSRHTRGAAPLTTTTAVPAREHLPAPAGLERAILLLLAAGCAATLAYDLQDTGWYYQQLPAITLFASALTLELLPWLSRLAALPRWLPTGAALLSTLAMTLTAFALRDDLRTPGAFAFHAPDPALFSTLPRDTPVAILTTSVEDSMMPVARFHLRWAQRTNNLWLLPAILRLEDPAPGTAPHRLSSAAIASLDTLQHRWMVEDLTRWRPALVLVERCQDPAVHCQELEDRHEDLLAWFARDAAFRGVWQSYRLDRRDGDYDAWVLRKASEHAHP